MEAKLRIERLRQNVSGGQEGGAEHKGAPGQGWTRALLPQKKYTRGPEATQWFGERQLCFCLGLPEPPWQAW